MSMEIRVPVRRAISTAYEIKQKTEQHAHVYHANILAPFVTHIRPLNTPSCPPIALSCYVNDGNNK